MHASFEHDAITLYLKYHYLPVSQFARILNSVEGTYDALARLYGLPDLFWGRPDGMDPIPLCIDQLQTGESVSVKVAFDQHFFPRIDFDPTGGLNVHLPRWSAVLVLTGLVLQWGQDRYKTHLEIEELLSKRPEQAALVSELDLRKLQDSQNPLVNHLDINVNQFYFEINQRNLTVVECCGEVLRDHTRGPWKPKK